MRSMARRGILIIKDEPDIVLGLLFAIVRNIARQHSGGVSISSQLGQGSTFRFQLLRA